MLWQYIELGIEYVGVDIFLVTITHKHLPIPHPDSLHLSCPRFILGGILPLLKLQIDELNSLPVAVTPEVIEPGIKPGSARNTTGVVVAPLVLDHGLERTF